MTIIWISVLPEECEGKHQLATLMPRASALRTRPGGETDWFVKGSERKIAAQVMLAVGLMQILQLSSRMKGQQCQADESSVRFSSVMRDMTTGDNYERSRYRSW